MISWFFRLLLSVIRVHYSGLFLWLQLQKGFHEYNHALLLIKSTYPSDQAMFGDYFKNFCPRTQTRF